MLFFVVARASFAQERIFLDEQIRFVSKNNNNNIYVIPFLYRLSSTNDHISITQLCQAFQSLMTKHNILRTALYLDTNGTIIQHCLDADIMIDAFQSFRFSIVNLHNDDHHINEVIKEILNQSNLFDLSKGRVIRCHILRHSICSDHTLLQNDDLILISIHHAVFDGTSTSLFIRDLSLAYDNNYSLSISDNALQYIDYSVHEHIMDMTSSRQFWNSQFQEYNLQRPLSLPMDRSRLFTDQRSGLASTAHITFDDEICTSFLDYASSHHLTLFQLGLAMFYVFLYKLTHGQSDLCISSINANRYRSELQNLIGMFVSTLPYRFQLDSHWSFDELVGHVREKCLSILEHSHYPLQHILTDFHLNQSNVPFLETMFDFITVSSDDDHLCLNGTHLQSIPVDEFYEVAKFDFSLTFIYNSTSDTNRLSCYFQCSHDLFNENTVVKIGQRFQHLLSQLFRIKSSGMVASLSTKSIRRLSLILSEEDDEINRLRFTRLTNIVEEGMSICLITSYLRSKPEKIVKH